MTTIAGAAYDLAPTAGTGFAPVVSMNKKGAPIAMKKNSPKKEVIATPRRPTILQFSPTAWAKLLFLRDAGETEIGGFGIAPHDDLLFVEDIRLVQQNCTPVHVEFDDEAVANFFDDQVDAGRRPEQFARLWLHTHPGNSPEPSGTDEATFARVFGLSEWAVMFILARGGQSYARLRFNAGPGVDAKIPVEVDFERPFPSSAIDEWKNEYSANVIVPAPEFPPAANPDQPLITLAEDDLLEDWWRTSWGEYADYDNWSQERDGEYNRDF
jgi:proteasome lid subunit RPN8/RPN11